MPKEGYESITISTESYDKLHADYTLHKEVLKLNGIFSFASYIEYLSGSKRPTTAEDLKEIACIQAQTLLIMSDFMMGVDKQTCLTNQRNIKDHMYSFLESFQEKTI